MMPSDKAVVFLQNHDTQHELRKSVGLRVRQPAGVPPRQRVDARPAVRLSLGALELRVHTATRGITIGPPSDANGMDARR